MHLSVFTKTWKHLTADELGAFVSRTGFDGIEYPLRPGFQIDPDDAEKELPKLAKKMEDYGLRIFSVASVVEERVFAACAAANVPLIRTFVPIGEDGFHPSLARAHAWMEQIAPLSEKYGVTVGIQNHIGDSLTNASGLYHFLERYSPERVAAVWDAAHNALAGEEPEIALSTVWPKLGMVNLKNAFYRRTTGPEVYEAQWEPYWTTGRQGLASWKRIIRYLKRQQYGGVVTLTTEYSDERNASVYIAEDIQYVKSLL